MAVAVAVAVAAAWTASLSCDAGRRAAEMKKSTMATTHISTATANTNAWLRWPHIVTCDRDKLEVHTITEAGAGQPASRCVLSVSLLRHTNPNATATAGRAANVVHGCDIRNGCLACGTATGIVLVMQLQPISAAAPAAVDVSDDATSSNHAAPAAAPAPATEPAPAITELSGHTKVVAFMRIGERARRLYTSSLDKSVRLWALPSGNCLQVVKAGTPVLQLALLPSDASAAADGADDAAPQKVLMGGGDGTVRLWDPACKKANRALSTLRFAHKDYVGEIRLTRDASRLLSCSRDGVLQTWKSDAKHGFLPAPEYLPARETGEGWRVDLTSQGLIGITRRGGVHLWRAAANEPLRLIEESFSLPMEEAPCDSDTVDDGGTVGCEADVTVDGDATVGGEADTDGPHRLRVAFVGVRPVAARGGNSSDGSSLVLEMHTARVLVPTARDGAATTLAGGSATDDANGGGGAAAASEDAGGATASSGGGGSQTLSGSRGTPSSVPAGWTRWCALAAEEGVAIDAALQQRLVMMETVATNTGRELAEATVRAFLRRSAIKE